MHNPLYLGLVHFKGKPYKGEHEPIIGQEKWERVQ
ncbi:MAG: recombinase family protein, partial [Candidatus Heimdallarchaeaceae archaeon]